MDIRYLILVLTSRCNLHCRYCYYGGIERPADMSPAVLRQAIGLAEASGAPFHLQLTGGEPTLVPALIETAAALAAGTGRCHAIGLQTNATCLNPDTLRMIQRHAIQVGVSLDGPPQVQQKERGSAAAAFKGLQLLEAAHIPFRVTTVVSRANAARLDELVLLLSGYAMARGIGLDLLVAKGRALEKGAPMPADRATLEAGLGRMRATLDAVNARRKIPIRWREWDMFCSNRQGPVRSAVFCQAGLGRSMAVTPDGRIFPCAQTVEDARFAAGTVWRPHVDRLSRLDNCHARPEICATCEVNAVCPGDCPSRLHYNRDREAPLVCVLYRALLRMGAGRTFALSSDSIEYEVNFESKNSVAFTPRWTSSSI